MPTSAKPNFFSREFAAGRCTKNIEVASVISAIIITTSAIVTAAISTSIAIGTITTITTIIVARFHLRGRSTRGQ